MSLYKDIVDRVFEETGVQFKFEKTDGGVQFTVYGEDSGCFWTCEFDKDTLNIEGAVYQLTEDIREPDEILRGILEEQGVL